MLAKNSGPGGEEISPGPIDLVLIVRLDPRCLYFPTARIVNESGTITPRPPRPGVGGGAPAGGAGGGAYSAAISKM
jgi:hypothetical protein